MTKQFSRRAFISATGAFVVAVGVTDWANATPGEVAAARSLKPDQLDSYIAIDKDGIDHGVLRQDRRRPGARHVDRLR